MIHDDGIVTCPYCKHILNSIGKNGYRWCVHCMMPMKADGNKFTDEEVRELIRDAKDID